MALPTTIETENKKYIIPIPKNQKMKTKNNFANRRERLLDYHKNLINPKSFFISKQEITLKYTETLRNDIKTLMRDKNIGWTKLSRLLKDCGYDYKPNAIQNYVNGSTFSIKDIGYFAPVIILLKSV